MIDHAGIGVHQFEVSARFYQVALNPLGYQLLKLVSRDQSGGVDIAGFGVPPKPDFWLHGGGANIPLVHVAFTAQSRDIVDAFYMAALGAGGRDNGPPGIRPHYHASYYAAYVLDPDGHNIEAVCHGPA